MIGIAHQDVEVSNFFNAYSQFKQKEEQKPEGLEDVEPEEFKQEKKKNKGITYLPGEKLLIKLGKEKEKERKKKQKTPQPDVERITKSLKRIIF